VARGHRDAATIEAAMRGLLASEAPLGEVDYVEIVGTGDLQPVARVSGETLIALAVRFGDTRLIDNVRVSASPTS
jgi:pantoate--beta-alanine ligase